MQGVTPGGLPQTPSPRSSSHRTPPGRPDPARRTARRDPAPSRLAYRLNRIWLTPLYRRALRVGLPAFILCLAAGLWLHDPERRAQMTGSIDQVIDRIQHRDEFMVRTMRIEGASETVDRALRAMLARPLPVSSFELDLDALRTRVMRLDAVEKVELRVLPDGILSASVVERQPALLWRNASGIDTIDATGHRVASISERDQRPDLPIIAGAGADRAAAEALALIDAAGPILPRLRGLERIGERRWDVVLDRDQRIMLPAAEALKALERAIALDDTSGLFGRDVVTLDLRDPGRAVVRLGLDARNAIRHARGEAELGADGLPLTGEAGTGAAGSTAAAEAKESGKTG